MSILRSAMHVLCSYTLGSIVGVIGSFVLLHQTAVPVFAAQMDPFRLENGTWGNGCDNWRYDSALWQDVTGDGIAEPFSYWWAGHSRFWNNTSVNSCWHADEGWASGNIARPSVDYAGVAGDNPTAVYFRTEHWNASTYWPGPLFEATVCRGVQARVWAPNGVYLSKVHYWHTEPGTGVLGTSWTNHWDVPGYGLAYRQIATVRGSDDYCYITGPHLHQSSDDPTTGSTADRYGGLSVVQFWLNWTLP